MSFKQYVDLEQMKLWRRHFHENPELSFEEFETADYIAKALEEMGVEVTRPTKTGVVGIIKGGKPGKTVGLRADIDALPVMEETSLDFASKKAGVMHACGHDAHAASLLGAAKVLMAIKDEIKGTVKLIFQPGEEKTPGGAQGLVDSGALNDVDMFFGTHVFLGEKPGVIASRVGPMTAAQDGYYITVKGRGGHGAQPQKSIDPVVIGSEIVINLNLIVSRSVDPLANMVITCGKFVAGTVNNVIPDTARLELSVRTNTPDGRKLAENRIRQVVDGICKAHGADYELEFEPGYAATINDQKAVDIVKAVAAKHLGEGSYIEAPMMMGSEDFSAYGQIAPGAFVGVMAGKADDGYIYNNHHPKFAIDEDALGVAAITYVGCAIDALEVL